MRASGLLRQRPRGPHSRSPASTLWCSLSALGAPRSTTICGAPRGTGTRAAQARSCCQRDSESRGRHFESAGVRTAQALAAAAPEATANGSRVAPSSSPCCRARLALSVASGVVEVVRVDVRASLTRRASRVLQTPVATSSKRKKVAQAARREAAGKGAGVRGLPHLGTRARPSDEGRADGREPPVRLGGMAPDPSGRAGMRSKLAARSTACITVGTTLPKARSLPILRKHASLSTAPRSHYARSERGGRGVPGGQCLARVVEPSMRARNRPSGGLCCEALQHERTRRRHPSLTSSARKMHYFNVLWAVTAVNNLGGGGDARGRPGPPPGHPRMCWRGRASVSAAPPPLCHAEPAFCITCDSGYKWLVRLTLGRNTNLAF